MVRVLLVQRPVVGGLILQCFSYEEIFNNCIGDIDARGYGRTKQYNL